MRVKHLKALLKNIFNIKTKHETQFTEKFFTI